ncbi:hypothetical protein ACFW2V_13515 [Streptomyces sp. NPDC058947]|uniref:hypothetical protein n=1 Tax=Streptomyces sp. NPDC058947 TaxID=3346675 RepID=UPI00369590F9
MSERKQDAWRVIINAKNGSGLAIYEHRREGIVDLPKPMTYLDAADYALRVAVRVDFDPLPAEITVDVWGRPDIGGTLMRQCSAVAVYDQDRGAYMRWTPWVAVDARKEIGDPEGAVVYPLIHEEIK